MLENRDTPRSAAQAATWGMKVDFVIIRAFG